MPSLPPSIYYHYYPFGSTDIITNVGILSKLASILLQSLVIIIIWMIGHYVLNEVYVHHSNIYDTYYLYLIGQLYWFLVPQTILLYILLTMLFDPLSVHKHCKYYIILTCILTLFITFILTSIISIKARHTNSVFNKHICNISISFCSFSIFQIILYSISFFISITLSTFTLYIIEILPKSFISILLQCIFCCKYRYWKLICSKQYRLKRKSKPDVRSTLLSSEIMSEMNVKDQQDLRNKFLLESIGNKQNDMDSNYCSCAHSKCCLCYFNLYSSHKFILLLMIINISFLICFAVSISMHKIGTTDIAQKHYVTVLIIWFFICFMMKIWMKQIGKHLDIVRLDIKLIYCSDVTIKKQIYDLTKRISGVPYRSFKTSEDSTSNIDNVDYDGFKFDISFEIAMEIFVQILYYSFYRDFSFIFYNPNWNEFLIFKAIDLLIIFVFYCIRIVPCYYEYTYKNIENEAFSKYLEQSSIISCKHSFGSQVFTVLSPEPSSILRADSDTYLTPIPKASMTPNMSMTPMKSMTPMDSIDEAKSVCYDERQISAYDDNDTIHINALDNIYEYYQKGLIHNNFKQISDKKYSSNIRFDTYYDWRNRISIDCVIQCIVMIITAFVSYCTVMVYYITGNHRVSFRISTYYFVISMLSELTLYGLLYGVLMKHSFNLFQPFSRLYAKSTHTHHYVLLFVICSLFLY